MESVKVGDEMETIDQPIGSGVPRGSRGVVRALMPYGFEVAWTDVPGVLATLYTFQQAARWLRKVEG